MFDLPWHVRPPRLSTRVELSSNRTHFGILRPTGGYLGGEHATMQPVQLDAATMTRVEHQIDNARTTEGRVYYAAYDGTRRVLIQVG